MLALTPSTAVPSCVCPPRFKEQHGHASPMSLSAGADLYLCNWCSVQRVAYRCRVLSSRRLSLLNSIEFDWTGADPLS